jgi:arylsulfatase A-like enzyme
MTFRRGLAFALASIALALGSGSEAADRPNVVLVIADDWSWPHAGVYGDQTVKTPNFDRVAREGVLFTRSFCASPSCTPSRGALLTGQAVHRLENGGNLWSLLPKKFACYPDLLEAAGYAVGLTGKGWGPGTLDGSGRTRNPAGPNFPSFEAFLKTVPAGKPFVYWYGSTDPHRPYEPGAGARWGLKAETVAVPPCLPDTPAVREDILDYYFEVERFDRAVGAVLKALEDRGVLDDTLVVVTSDNGMPFPRCKANLYDTGTHMPLAVRWPKRLPKGVTVDAFVSHADLAPTFLEAAGLKPLPEMTGRSLLPLIDGRPEGLDGRDAVFLERERHANVREGNLSYPCRAIRTKEFLYIRNLRPDRWPAGDPVLVHSVGPFGDVDPSPTKDLILARRDDRDFAWPFRLAFEKRPAEELYDLKGDPHQLENIAGHEAYAGRKADLRDRLDRWMAATGDPLAHDTGSNTGREPFDDYPYVGPAEPGARGASKAKGQARPRLGS